jgi:hypothetical protein
MDFKARTLIDLRAHRSAIGSKSVVAGFDGFVDTIVSPVALRRGPGDDFTPFETISAFAERILGAAGKSTNIEFYPRMEKLGGNGPIMAGALLAAGAQVSYIGPLGRPALHPVFAALAKAATVYSLAEPAKTTAAEFTDGKLMLGQMRSLDEITYAAVVAGVGESRLVELCARADLIAVVNWTMIPHMTSLFRDMTARLLPRLSGVSRRFFFDLCDPEKRSVRDLQEALTAIADFSPFGRVTLGLNLKEAQQVAVALGVEAAVGEDEASLRATSAIIRQK